MEDDKVYYAHSNVANLSAMEPTIIAYSGFVSEAGSHKHTVSKAKQTYGESR